MFRIYLAAVDVIPAAIILIPLFLILYWTVYKKCLAKSILSCLFCLYLSAVFSLVGIPNVTYFRPDLNLNLIPFLGMVQDLKNSFLNIALFVPLGCFLPVLWAHFRKMISAVTFGFALSVSIEVLQMLTYRATDINDVITNVLGTAFGFLLVKPIIKAFQIAGDRREEIYVLCCLSFSVMFFIHPFLSPLLWDNLL